MPHYVLKNPNPGLLKLYTFLGRIGQPGQFGYACMAKKKTEDGKSKTCAVKVIKKERFVKNVQRSHTDKMFEAFRLEIDIMKKATHKNVIQYEDSFEDKDNLYIAMEVCTGGELFDHIQEVQASKGFSEKSAAGLLTQIFTGLNYLHSELKIAHCDLKPDNFLFVDKEENATIRIIDFGMAKFLNKEKFFRDLCGTPYYIAPEVWKGQYASACDMWSMGVITFVILFGFPPFHGQSGSGGESDRRIQKAIQKGFDAKVRSGYGAFFPKAIPRSKVAYDFIGKLLDSDPAKRMTAEEALHHPFLTGSASAQVFDPLVLKGIRNFHSGNKFKLLVLENLVDELDSKEIKQVRDQFKKMDEDGSGEIEVKELLKVFTELKPDEVKAVMANLDIDGDGKINLAEFSATFVNRKVSHQNERMWKIFNDMDANKDGVLDHDEIHSALKGKANKEETQQIINQIDKDNNGKISYNEFLDAWYKTEVEKFGGLSKSE